MARFMSAAFYDLSTTVRWIAGALLAAMMMVMVFAHDASAAPTFQAAGTAVGASGAATPTWPTGLYQVGDIALLFVEREGSDLVTLSPAAGFVEVPNSPQFTASLDTNHTRLAVFWARATSTSMSEPTVLRNGGSGPQDHSYAQILIYRGVISTGN